MLVVYRGMFGVHYYILFCHCLGEDEWKRLSERERQLRLMKMKLEAKRLQRENKLDELARLLGEGFANDVNLRKLLGENREK